MLGRLRFNQKQLLIRVQLLIGFLMQQSNDINCPFYQVLFEPTYSIRGSSPVGLHIASRMRRVFSPCPLVIFRKYVKKAWHSCSGGLFRLGNGGFWVRAMCMLQTPFCRCCFIVLVTLTWMHRVSNPTKSRVSTG